jgi:GNAT superfamily N-acetyltransferase
MPLHIREYEPGDARSLRQCVVALQEYERAIDPRRPHGEAMADAYCANLHHRCRTARGQILVAERDATVVGFVAVVAEEPFTELDEPPGTYALVTDLVVLDPHRSQGVGHQLLERAESYARQAGASELRIGVLAQNSRARSLYLAVGFQPHLEILAKWFAE